MGKTFVYNDGKREEERDSLALQFGMFFDGTLNSKENTRIREVVQANTAKDWERELYKKHGGTPEDDVSFQNDYTNVARMQMGCKEKYAIYVEGIGTEAIPKDIESQGQKERKNTIENLGDKQEGFAMGSGPTGIRAKVRRGCELLIEVIKKRKNSYENKKELFSSLTLDVFGFSRGAAAARNFVYEVNSTRKRRQDIQMREGRHYGISKTKKSNEDASYYEVTYVDETGAELDKRFLENGRLPKMGYLGYLLLLNDILTKEELANFTLIIRFIGIYDTVSSHEDVSKSEFLFYTTAGAHLLYNQFQDDVEALQLNNLGYFQKAVHFTAQDEHRENFDLTRMNKSSRSLEFNFPGVHCDIGGAYLTGIEFKKAIENSTYKNEFLLKNRVQELINEHWYKPGQIHLKEDRVSKDTVITGTRFLKKEYSYIPLHFMEKLFRDVIKDEAKNVLNRASEETYSLKVKQTRLLAPQESIFDFSTSIKAVYETVTVDDQVLVNAKDRLEKYINGDAEEWKFVSDEERKRREIRNQVVEENNKINPMEEDLLFKQYERDMFGNEKEKNVEQAPEGAKELEVPVVSRYDPQAVLRKLRNEYLHWSARRNGLGMDPRNNYKRVEH